MIFASGTSRRLRASFAAAALAAGAIAFSVPAEARIGGGGFHGGMGGFHGGMGGFRGVGGIHHGFAGGMGGFHRFGGMGRFHSAGLMHRTFIHRSFVSDRGFHRRFAFNRHHRFRNAFALGLIGAAVIPAAYADDCFVVRKRVISSWGGVVIKKTVVCA